MTSLVWDQVGERTFEAGVDRGVLYLSDGSGVPWNGLKGVDEDASGARVEAFYYDGVKYLNVRYPDDFSATLRAITFPDEFMEYDGIEQIASGFYGDSQPVTKRFGLSYRTRVGNDVEGLELGYKIHILYNLTATPSAKVYATLSSSVAPVDFSWKITGVPVAIEGFRPTVHIILDSTEIDTDIFANLEALLYGDDVNEPRLPTISELLAVHGGGGGGGGGGGETITVTDNGDGTWTVVGPDGTVDIVDASSFSIDSTALVYADANSYTVTTL